MYSRQMRARPAEETATAWSQCRSRLATHARSVSA